MPTDITPLGSVMEHLGKTYIVGNVILLLQHSAVLGPNLILFCTKMRNIKVITSHFSLARAEFLIISTGLTWPSVSSSAFILEKWLALSTDPAKSNSY